MKVGSLFSGGGLGDFGFIAAGMEITWQCEIDEYCQKILALRYPESTKYRDIKTLKGADLEPVDIITGGFPCQPFSVAGKQKGKEDNRYLWPEMLRVIKECRPRWIVGENVPGIINLALDTVCSDLEAEGYEVWPIVFPSHALGAWHKRDRLWIVCHAKYDGQPSSQESRGIETRSDCGKARTKQASESSRSSEQYAPMANAKSNGTQGGIFEPRTPRDESIQSSEDVADTSNAGVEGICGRENSSLKNDANTDADRLQGCCEARDIGSQGQNSEQLLTGYDTFREYWQSEPSVGRVANGIADRVHRLKMLGNGQTPACTYVIGKMIMDIEKQSLLSALENKR